MQTLKHPNVITLLGVVVNPPTFCLVLEFAAHGDLFDSLMRPTPPGFTMRVARGVAAGMAYLHSRGILHRDLKSANVLLLDPLGTPKLTDFGTATRGATQQPQRAGAPLTAETGTYRWMAPEVMKHETYSRPADVFSYGMLFFELITHEYPFADRGQLGAAVAVAMEEKRPTLPTGLPPAIEALMRSCWETDTQLRPTFVSIDVSLAQVDAALTADERAWLDVPNGHRVYSPAAPVPASLGLGKRPKPGTTSDESGIDGAPGLA